MESIERYPLITNLHPVAEQVDNAIMHRPGNVTIACSVGDYPKRRIFNPNDELMGKICDSFLYFVRNAFVRKPFRFRQRD